MKLQKLSKMTIAEIKTFNIIQRNNFGKYLDLQDKLKFSNFTI